MYYGLPSEFMDKGNMRNLKGLKYGRGKYRTYKQLKGIENPNWKGGKPKCFCGKQLTKYSAKHCRLHTPANRGKNHKDWQGGITPINEKLRKSIEYKLWRKAVFERDNYTCIWGGKEHGSKLHADHIKPFALFPELRFAIDNGRTLCKDCHKLTDTYGGRNHG